MAMNGADYQAALTVTGGTSLGNVTTIGNATAMAGDWYYWPTWTGNCWPTVQYIHTTTPPTWCSGEVHVFACEHAETCKCGETKRAKPKKCGACGK